MNNVILSDLDLNLILKLSQKLYIMCNENDDIICDNDLKDAQNLLKEATDKYEICTAIETMHYMFSLILSSVRQKKRNVISAIFKQKPKLAEEKSVLEKKLDAEPEYAKEKEKEEYLFQFLEHLTNIRNNINWLFKSDEEY